MRRLIFVLTLVCVAAGCGVASTSEVKLSDGSNATYINCKMIGHRACLDAAGEQCPNGYDIMDEQTAKPVESGAKTHNTMLVRCK